MELKRGWWNLPTCEIVRLVGELGGSWYGHEGDYSVRRWVSGELADTFANATYLGDGPEPVEPGQQPDPRDAEIKRLKAENADLSKKIVTAGYESKTFRNMADYHANQAIIAEAKASVLKNECDNLRRLIGDH